MTTSGEVFSRRAMLRTLGGTFLVGACGGDERRPLDSGATGDASQQGNGDAGTGGDDAGVDGAADGDAAMSSEAGAGDSSAGDPGCEATTADVLGPFHEPGAPARTMIAAPDEPGQRLRISGQVMGTDCAPLGGAVLDVWQADVDGNYHGADEDYRLRGIVQADSEGRFEIETIMPGRYELASGPRPAHIHFIVSQPGHAPLTTQLYFEGDPFVAPNDACGSGCRSDDPARIIPLTGDVVREGHFDIFLART